MHRRCGRPRLPDARAGRHGGEDLQRSREVGRQVDLPGLHARQRSGDSRPERHGRQRLDERDRRRTARRPRPADFKLAENTMRYLVHTPPKPEWDYQTFDFDKDLRMVDAWSQKADAKNPDLSKFRKRGGKLLMTYGWADAHPAADDGRQLLPAGHGQERVRHARLLPAVHGSGHGALRGRHRPGPPRSGDRDHQLGGEGRGALDHHREPDGERHGDAHAPALRLPAGGALHGQGSMDDAANFSCVAP